MKKPSQSSYSVAEDAKSNQILDQWKAGLKTVLDNPQKISRTWYDRIVYNARDEKAILERASIAVKPQAGLPSVIEALIDAAQLGSPDNRSPSSLANMVLVQFKQLVGLLIQNQPQYWATVRDSIDAHRAHLLKTNTIIKCSESPDYGINDDHIQFINKTIQPLVRQALGNIAMESAQELELLVDEARKSVDYLVVLYRVIQALVKAAPYNDLDQGITRALLQTTIVTYNELHESAKKKDFLLDIREKIGAIVPIQGLELQDRPHRTEASSDLLDRKEVIMPLSVDKARDEREVEHKAADQDEKAFDEVDADQDDSIGFLPRQETFGPGKKLKEAMLGPQDGGGLPSFWSGRLRRNIGQPSNAGSRRIDIHPAAGQPPTASKK